MWCRYTWAERDCKNTGFQLALVLAFSSAENVSWIGTSVWMLLSTSYCVLIISHKRHEMSLITESKCHQIFFFLQPCSCCIKNSWAIAASPFQDLATSADGGSGQEYWGMLMDGTGVSWMNWVQEKFALNLLMLYLSEAIRIHCLFFLWWAMSLLENGCS